MRRLISSAALAATAWAAFTTGQRAAVPAARPAPPLTHLFCTAAAWDAEFLAGGPRDRARAAGALDRLGADGLPYLVGGLLAGDERVPAAAEVLTRRTGMLAPHAERLLPALRRWLGGDDPAAQARACRLAGALGETARPLRPLLEAEAEDGPDGVARAAADALARIPD